MIPGRCVQPYPVLHKSQPLKIAWFGSANNIHYLCRDLTRLMSSLQSAPSYHLDILSSDQALDMAKKTFIRSTKSSLKPWKLRLFSWDSSDQPRQLQEVLGPAHLSWLPSDPNNIIKSGVSHNRLVDSVRSGCIPVTSPMSSYLELRKLALIGDDHVGIIENVISNYSRLVKKHESLRDKLLSRFDPLVNLARWEDFLQKACEHKKASD